MDDIRVLVARYTRDLLVYDEQLIKIGRSNAYRQDNNANYIVIDESFSEKISSSEKYDSDIEEYSQSNYYRSELNLDFFGTDAHKNAYDWVAKQGMQEAREIQKILKIEVLSPSQVQNIGALTGTYYGNRFRVIVSVRYSYQITEATLPIESAQIDIYNNGNRNTKNIINV